MPSVTPPGALGVHSQHWAADRTYPRKVSLRPGKSQLPALPFPAVGRDTKQLPCRRSVQSLALLSLAPALSE